MIIPVKSPEIVDAFIKSGLALSKVNIEQTGRDIDPVYKSLIMYLKKHDNLGISVKKVKGEIYLVRNANRDTTHVCGP